MRYSIRPRIVLLTARVPIPGIWATFQKSGTALGKGDSGLANDFWEC